MRYRVICVALAGLALLASAVPSQAATKTFSCTERAPAAWNVGLFLVPPECGVFVTCPGTEFICTIKFIASGSGIGAFEVSALINGALSKRCSGSLSCRTGESSVGVFPGLYFVAASLKANSVSVLPQVRLDVKLLT